jgi:hypothetical protein
MHSQVARAEITPQFINKSNMKTALLSPPLTEGPDIEPFDDSIDDHLIERGAKISAY